MLKTQEHSDLIAQFERDLKLKERHVEKEPKRLWPQGNIYQVPAVNEQFLAYRRGYAYGKALFSVTTETQLAASVVPEAPQHQENAEDVTRVETLCSPLVSGPPQPPSEPISRSVESEELEALKAWRADVTVALQREGGAFYADVPNHIRALVAGWKQSTMLNEAILKPCIWNLDDVGCDSVYETQCGHNFYFDDDENPFTFCGYCGGRMVVALTSEETADETAR